jgi:putative ABC transport system ATP-binding protein
MKIFSVKDLFKAYDNGLVKALSGLSMNVEENEIVAVMGPSGSGKSTLLCLMGTLDRPTSGQILYKGRELFSHLPLHRFRSSNIGFVFQFHHLLPSLTLLENVELPLVPSGIPAAERRSRATALMEQMDLTSRQSFLPAKTSGGERQRAAIARALIHRPEVVLADEPTGNLDTETGEMVMNLLIEKCRERETTAVIATHNPEVAAMADRQLFLRNGSVV